MQRIAVLFFCAGIWTTNAAADPCDKVGAVVGGFAGGAAGWGIAAVAGPATGWVSAGLYGAGITVAGLTGGAVGAVGCNRFAENFKNIGEMYCKYSGFNIDCEPMKDVTESLYADFLLCPSCSWDEIFGAFLMADDSRQDWLRRMQYGKMGFYSATTQVIPRNHIGTLGGSVLNSYFQGLQAGFAAQRSMVMYVMPN